MKRDKVGNQEMVRLTKPFLEFAASRRLLHMANCIRQESNLRLSL
jgi:hypothetical protein